ncbi:MAG: hypothetical protein LH478_02270 [Chitinophagaceae bacterium]|nr:hypothetical protein [Chitinophagaceae bacterium]
MNLKLLCRFILLLPVVVMQHNCKTLPVNVISKKGNYSTNSQRKAWTAKLQSESVIPVRATFHTFGHLLAISGKFLLPEASIANVKNFNLGWIEGSKII